MAEQTESRLQPVKFCFGRGEGGITMRATSIIPEAPQAQLDRLIAAIEREHKEEQLKQLVESQREMPERRQDNADNI